MCVCWNLACMLLLKLARTALRFLPRLPVWAASARNQSPARSPSLLRAACPHYVGLRLDIFAFTYVPEGKMAHRPSRLA